ncbi:MAG: hypothetical protein GEU90_14395 [Gemmatimonas sp.]|nr:hypothetical protein [Gemmatimonas sp.]
MRFEETAPVLRALRAWGERPFDPAELASDLGVHQGVVETRLGQLNAAGLILLGDLPTERPLLRNAAEQYLALHGEVGRGVLHFLPQVIDDLHARAALLAGGAILVDEFRFAIHNGEGAEHAVEVVPPAFAKAMDAGIALELFAAAVALMARLSAGEPAGCVAEELLAVELMSEGEAWLAMQVETGELTEGEAKQAAGEFRSLFELFEDDDVLNLFEMSEPADAALAGQSEISHQMGVADQRLEAWFKPFSWTAATGYLGDGGPPASTGPPD